MWLLHTITIGFYSIQLLPFHLPLWCMGYLIRSKLNSRIFRRIYLGLLIGGLVFCDCLCEYCLVGFDRWGGFIAIAILFDLLIGYAAAALPPLFRRLFQRYLQYLETDDEEE